MGRARQNEIAIVRVVQLRHVARRSDPSVRAELGKVIVDIENDVAESVGKATVSRILGVSTTTIDKWVERGVLRAVPGSVQGRSEIAKEELFGVAEQVHELRRHGHHRGLLAEVLLRLEREDPTTAWPIDELHEAASRPFDRSEYISAAPKADWGPDD